MDAWSLLGVEDKITVAIRSEYMRRDDAVMNKMCGNDIERVFVITVACDKMADFHTETNNFPECDVILNRYGNKMSFRKVILESGPSGGVTARMHATFLRQNLLSSHLVLTRTGS